jgi:photosystem II stability/assembly factor-like uncharacterized protein
VDDAKPFYRVYGGTQDNGTTGGPSRTVNRIGIRSAEWGVFGGGDGMQPRVDPDNPDILYVMMQNGGISRYDRRTSASTPIRPRTADMMPRIRWHWDTPFLISPHSPARLYLAGNRLFRSDDRGDKWQPISPDLTRQLDRDKLEVMGKVWGNDAVTKNRFTTDLGVASALTESPKQEGLLYVGTDDGLIQISDDGGKTWRKEERFPGVPEYTYVSAVCASPLDADTVFAAFNHHQRGDFKPYLLRSGDRGKTWLSIAGDLPDRGPIWCIAADPVNKDLLFVGTEFGLFFTTDGGRHWSQFRNGVPVIPFRDLAIQRREGDLVCATFGRGFYVLDDIAPLRHLTAETRAKPGVLFPIRKTPVYSEATHLRADPNAFTTPNPPFGALLTYHLREDAGKIALTVTDADGKTVRELTGPTTAGVHRIVWDLRASGMRAPLVKPGPYKVTLSKVNGDKPTPLGEPQAVEVVAIE